MKQKSKGRCRASSPCMLLAIVCALLLANGDGRSLQAQNRRYDELQQLQARALRALEEYEIDAAIQYLNQLVAQNPNSFLAHAKLAESYFIRRDIELAYTYAARAQYLNQSDTELQILRARIHGARNELAIAMRILDALEQANPLHAPLQLARAELAIADYNYEDAIRIYESILTRDRNNVAALLGLALLREEQRDFDSAEALIARAREQAPQQLAVYFLSAEHYYLRGQYRRAAEYIQVAGEIAARDPETEILASEIARAMGDYEQAEERIETLIETNNRSPYYWYIHATLLEERGEYTMALGSLQRALLLQRDYEPARLAAEHIIITQFPERDVARVPFAEYRIARARALRERNLLNEARIHAARALQIYPSSQSARLLFADIERARGFDAAYLRELQFAQLYGDDSQFTADVIESVSSLLSKKPATTWNVDQFSLTPDTITIGVALNRTLSRVGIDATLRNVGNYMRDLLNLSDRVTVADTIIITNSVAPSRINEELNAYDYVVHTVVREAENSIQLVVDLIHPLSRSVITNYRATFVGAERYHRTVHNITERIDAALPLRAQIIAREEDRVLINAGSIHGIAPEEELVVIEQGALTPSESSLAFRYPDISEVGTIVITEVDDRVAEGEVMRKEIFDTFTIGDEVFMHSRALPQPSPRDTPSPLYDYILQIR